ncbi:MULTISPECIES: DUF481 domain-containing protein [Niastella]|uniref:DUF481 domain-containing protein n=1 Tax=Niastella soli TaxID=2821487 RepID=A0ABS3Z159_9BACT|nr:DUF481 domain-containing protein [Niastella soli]MBO9203885.1 DUF481 domain-containing protein [Niastella soli]
MASQTRRQCLWYMRHLYTFITLLVFIILGNGVFAQIKDTIILYNGQVLIGEVKGAQYGEITIDDVDLKFIHVKQYKIRFLTTYRSFRIETNDKKLLLGMIKPSNKDGQVNILLDSSTVFNAEIISLNTITPFGQNFFQQLNGSFSTGFTYTKSSDIGQLNLSANIFYFTRYFDYQLAVSMNGTLDSSKYSRDREEASFFTAYNFSPTWFAAVNLAYQRNLELDIARRYQQMVGGGNKLMVRKYSQLYAITGLVFNQEKSTSDEFSGLLLEVPILLKFNFFKRSHPDIQISSTQTVFFGLTQKGRIRYSGNTSFSWQLIRDFYLTVNPYTNFDNQSSENSDFDFGVSVSVSYKF